MCASPTSNQAAQNTWKAWKSKYRGRNDQDPPIIYEELNKRIRTAQRGRPPPKFPKETDFPKNIETRVIAFENTKKDVQCAIVVLHGYAADTLALSEFAEEHLLGPRTVCILVRGLKAIIGTENDEVPPGYCWSDEGDYTGDKIHTFQARNSWLIKRVRTSASSSSRMSGFSGPSRANTIGARTDSLNHVARNNEANSATRNDGREDSVCKPTFEGSTEYLGLEVITNVLIQKCGFDLGDIALVGHDQGGSAALAVAAACWEAKLGGVVSIGGRLPSDFAGSRPNEDSSSLKSRTRVLLLGGKLGEINDRQVERVRSAFCETVDGRGPGKDDDFGKIENEKLREFLAYQFWRDEWRREAAISFDGGGIRGYGSLLILKALMDKIGVVEKRMDHNQNDGKVLSESSFSPCQYPKELIPPNTEHLSALGADQLYLPCHYFTFVGGTSTGGLIGIMISRFRMTVRQALEEYKKMSNGIFGHPRPPLSRLFLHKFDAGYLENAIRDVVSRHGEMIDPAMGGEVQYPSDEAICKTIVAARADINYVTRPFLFRTYNCSDAVRNERNAGAAASCSIIKVARATSAAPGYFRPIEIERGQVGFDTDQMNEIQFMDGGFGTNNPSHEILKDIKRKRAARNEVVEVFASVGTGRKPDNLRGKLSGWIRLYHETAREMTDVLRAHESMIDDSGKCQTGSLPNFRYFRFDGGEALGLIPMDQWSGRRKSQMKINRRETGKKTLDAIRISVDEYLDSEEVQQDLEKLANILVLRRRSRTRDAVAWERYATGSSFKCSQVNCGFETETRGDFKAHLEEKHAGISINDLAVTIKDSKRWWKYRQAGEGN